MKAILIILIISVYVVSNCQEESVIENKLKNLKCTACHATIKKIQQGEHLIDKEIQVFLEVIANGVCWGKKIQKKLSVCKGAIHEMAPAILDSIVSRYLGPDELCPMAKLCPQVYEILTEEDYIKEVLKDKPADSEWPQVNPQGKKVKMIHISDLHFDFKYQEGAKAVCDYPLCCREESGKVKEGDVVAGHWGTLSACNIPQRTLEQLFIFIKENIVKEDEKIFLFWTGDNTSHDVWEQSKENNIKSTQFATDFLKSLFSDNKNIMFLPQTGNHEAFPVNVFDYKSEREVGFRQVIADMWRDWIGDDAAKMLQQRGYYKKEFEGYNFKVIAFDTQVCNSENWYLIKDPTDPSGFLDWARQELYDSEKKNQVVYLNAHMPTRSCLPRWGTRMKALVDRFSKTIRGQIYGHSHGESLNLYRGYSKNETLNVAYISSSVTTYSNRNPSFRVFEIDEETMIPTNYFQYRLDLQKANDEKAEKLIWDQVYNFKEEYGAESMHPKDVQKVVDRLLIEPELVKKFAFQSNSGFADANPNAHGFYCEYSSVLSDEQQMCNSGQIGKPGIEDRTIEFLQGPWRQRIQN